MSRALIENNGKTKYSLQYDKYAVIVEQVFIQFSVPTETTARSANNPCVIASAFITKQTRLALQVRM